MSSFMGKDFGFWFNHQCSPWQSANLNYTNVPPDLGLGDINPAAFPTFNSPYVSLTAFSLPKLVDVNEHQQWCYQYPYQFYTPASILTQAEAGVSVSPQTGFLDTGTSNVHKGLFVFDQTGNRTSLMLGSVCPTNASKLPSKGFVSDPSAMKRSPDLPLSGDKLSWIGLEETDVSGARKDEDEMDEDTEELDALLYSDDEVEEDEEEASTGHSPFDISECQNVKNVHDIDEVAIPTPTKRRRLNEDNHESNDAVMDTASSGKPIYRTSLGEDDAESSCIKVTVGPWTKSNSADCSSKRQRRRKIKETVGVLRSIIPGGKGKDPSAVLDDAIRYLRSLQLRAKALGVGDCL